jgi:signal transduction histidine kinase
MVLDVLYYTKSRELELTEVDLRAFVEELAAGIWPQADQAGVTFVLNLTGVEGTIEADTVALSSAMVNFLENALDACHMDRTKKDHTITFTTRRLGGRVVFEITDNGLGMEQETKNNLFTLFFSSKGSRGTGIGLFVSNHVITQHHGHISVESEFGKGTRIQVEIPAKQTSSPPSIGYSKDPERHVLGAELH